MTTDRTGADLPPPDHSPAGIDAAAAAAEESSKSWRAASPIGPLPAVDPGSTARDFEARRVNGTSSIPASLHPALDAFEESWAPEAHDRIERALALAGPVADGPGSIELLVELIRIDIDRSYAAGRPIDLQDYWKRFPHLIGPTAGNSLEAICYEDYRARRSRGLDCPLERWMTWEAVRNAPWFLRLVAESGGSPGRLLKSLSRKIEVAAVETRATARSESSTAFSRSQTSHSPADSTPEPRQSLRPGSALGDFDLVSLLGTGAFSQVFLARQRTLGDRFVALKVVQRPLREPAHLARLSHTGIVPLYSCQQVGRFWLLCMPYCGSVTLADWLRSSELPASRTGQSLLETLRNARLRMTAAGPPSSVSFPSAATSPSSAHSGSSGPESARPAASATHAPTAVDERLRKWHDSLAATARPLQDLSASRFAVWFLRQLAAALAHAHQRGIVHGDLKPANILIRHDGEPALIDFNLSQSTDSESVWWAGGTLPYMPSEQLRALLKRAPEPLAPQGDVFAAGAIVFELTEGRLPFPTPSSTADADLERAVGLRAVAPGFRADSAASPGLQAILRRCLEASPGRRYASGVELLEDIEREWSHRPLLEAPDPWTSRVRKLIARHPRAFSAGSVLAVAMVVLAMLATTAWQFRERARRLDAVERFNSFESQSAELIGQLLAVDGSGPGRSTRNGESRLDECLDALLTSDTVPLDWADAPVLSYLNAAEQRRVTERLLAIGVLTSLNDLAAGRRRAPDDSPARQRLQGLVEKSPEQIGPDALLFTQLRLLPTAAAEPASQMAQHRDSPAPGSGFPTESAVDRLLRAARLTYAGRLNAALDLLDQAAPPDSLRMVHWMLRGRLQLEKGLAREAVSSFSMMLADHADSPVVYLNRGLASFRAGQLKEAGQDFTSVINLDPGNSAGWVNRAFVRAAQRETTAAIDDVTQALQREPDSNKLLLIRSRWLREAGRLQEARADYDRALQRPPVTADDWVSVALARLPGEPQRALADLQSAETLHGASSTILQSMAHVYSEHLQQPAEALRRLDRLLEAQPRFQKALAGRAVLHARAGRTQDAREDLQKLSALDSDLTAESIYQMACTLAICSSRHPEMRPEALKQLARAIRRGYGGQLLRQDPDLDAIRDAEEFRHIEAAWQLTGDP